MGGTSSACARVRVRLSAGVRRTEVCRGVRGLASSTWSCPFGALRKLHKEGDERKFGWRIKAQGVFSGGFYFLDVERHLSVFTCRRRGTSPRIKRGVTFQSSNHASGHRPQGVGTGTEKDIGTSVAAAALFTEPRTRWHPRCPRREQRLIMMRSIHTPEYYSALQGREILTHATTWVKREDIRQGREGRGVSV